MMKIGQTTQQPLKQHGKTYHVSLVSEASDGQGSLGPKHC